MGPDFVQCGALALTRLAALQGQVVGYRDFERLVLSLDGQALSGVPMAGKIAALWRTRFPLGEVRVPDWPPSPSDVPALWLGPTETEGGLLLVMGVLANGSLSCLDEYGNSQVLRPEQAHLGRLLVLKSDPERPRDAATERQALPQLVTGQPSTRPSRSPLVLIGQLVSALIALVLRRE